MSRYPSHFPSKISIMYCTTEPTDETTVRTPASLPIVFTIKYVFVLANAQKKTGDGSLSFAYLRLQILFDRPLSSKSKAIVPGLEVVKPCFAIVDIAPVAEGVISA